ncbi:endonuclease domain-containing protein [Demequina sp. NBRC 110057]|uniref:endonuclease domain-containing protein n=1 Tax=Demequina sp. NBRC 110057 TaxID=1570346 RepID=UPI000A0533D4|nr:DUF559 domain-containing protein [Demequina sp. NBRC 110057]
MAAMRPIPGLVALDGSLAEFLAANAHAFTRGELVSGWTRHALEMALDGQAVARILPGVYAGAPHRNVPVVRGEALNLWQPTALVTGPLALRLMSPTLPMPGAAHIRVANGHRPRSPTWVRVLQGAPVRARTYASGVACVTGDIAVLDAWKVAAPASRLDVLWRALWARVCTAQALDSALARAPRVVARRDLARVLGWFEEGATSPLEVRAKHETFRDARFREFEWQAPVLLPNRRAVVDMLHRRAMVAVELDGDRYHSTREARDADRERQTELTTGGYAVLRFGWHDITRRPEWCRDVTLATVAGRLARPSGT